MPARDPVEFYASSMPVEGHRLLRDLPVPEEEVGRDSFEALLAQNGLRVQEFMAAEINEWRETLDQPHSSEPHNSMHIRNLETLTPVVAQFIVERLIVDRVDRTFVLELADQISAVSYDLASVNPAEVAIPHLEDMLLELRQRNEELTEEPVGEE